MLLFDICRARIGSNKACLRCPWQFRSSREQVRRSLIGSLFCACVFAVCSSSVPTASVHGNLSCTVPVGAVVPRLRITMHIHSIMRECGDVLCNAMQTEPSPQPAQDCSVFCTRAQSPAASRSAPCTNGGWVVTDTHTNTCMHVCSQG